MSSGLGRIAHIRALRDKWGPLFQFILGLLLLCMDELAAADVEELQKLKDIGPVVAASIRAFFANAGNREMLERFKAFGVWPRSRSADETAGLPLAGKIFFFTGGIPGMILLAWLWARARVRPSCADR